MDHVLSSNLRWFLDYKSVICIESMLSPICQFSYHVAKNRVGDNCSVIFTAGGACFCSHQSQWQSYHWLQQEQALNNI